MEKVYHGQRLTTWFLWKEAIKISDIESRLCAVCGNKSPAGDIVSNYIRSFSRGKCNPKLMFGETIRKLRKRP
jgi:hypothetical protein